MSVELILKHGEGIALKVSAGAVLKVTNLEGGQVVDMWAINAADPDERLSMAHTRTSLSRLAPRAGDGLYSTRRRPLLTLVQDTSPGVHDTLIAACDPERYRQLGGSEDHASCERNFHRALAEHGIELEHVPSPLNLFMNIPWRPDGELEFQPSPARAGDHVIFAAALEVIVVLSACPMDLNPINRAGPSDIGLQVMPGAR